MYEWEIVESHMLEQLQGCGFEAFFLVLTSLEAVTQKGDVLSPEKKFRGKSHIQSRLFPKPGASPQLEEEWVKEREEEGGGRRDVRLARVKKFPAMSQVQAPPSPKLLLPHVVL